MPKTDDAAAWKQIQALVVKGALAPLSTDDVSQLKRLWSEFLLPQFSANPEGSDHELAVFTNVKEVKQFITFAANSGPLTLLTLHFAGLVEWYLYADQCLNRWGGPMNGQDGRVAIVKEIFDHFRVNAIVEAGTFRADTSVFLRETSNAPVYTCEAYPRFFMFASARLAEVPGVFVYPEETTRFLDRRAKDPFFPKERVFFYLDAHWGKDLPIAQEFATIFANWKESVLLIDDFRVPGDDGYGYDDYGDGKVLDYEHVKVPDEVDVYWPTLSSDQETGAKRGCMVLATPGAIPDASALKTLRPHQAK